MKKKIFVFIGSVVCLLCNIATGVAGVPQMINFQGRLTDEEDNALNDTLSVTISIYADSTGGTALWAETNNSVIVSKGIFNVLLGSINPIPDTVFTGPERWLGMAVEGDNEMTPRKSIASVGYAFHAATSNTAEYAHIATSDGDWETSGDNIYRLTGNVGIGLDNPSLARLQIQAGQDVAGIEVHHNGTNDNAGRFLIKNSDSWCAALVGETVGSGPALYANAFGSGHLLDLRKDLHTKVVVDNDGNVGIGTADPSEKLEVDGNAKVNGQLDVNSHKIINVANPTSNQDVATKSYVDNSVGGQNLSNVVFCWGLTDNLHFSTDPENYGAFSTSRAGLVIYECPTYSQPLLKSKFQKFSGISTITFYAYYWAKNTTSEDPSDMKIKFDVGGQSNTIDRTVSNETFEGWENCAVDVSALINGTVYDLTIEAATDYGDASPKGQLVLYHCIAIAE